MKYQQHWLLTCLVVQLALRYVMILLLLSLDRSKYSIGGIQPLKSIPNKD